MWFPPCSGSAADPAATYNACRASRANYRTYYNIFFSGMCRKWFSSYKAIYFLSMIFSINNVIQIKAVIITPLFISIHAPFLMSKDIVAPSPIPKAEKHPAIIQKSFAVMIQVSIFMPPSSDRISIMIPLPCITVLFVCFFQHLKDPECEPEP